MKEERIQDQNRQLLSYLNVNITQNPKDGCTISLYSGFVT
jgi:hypothetical protein